MATDTAGRREKGWVSTQFVEVGSELTSVPVAAVIPPTPTPVPPTPTPVEWVPRNGHYYTLTAPMTWKHAEAQAMRWGGHLVTINDREEELWLRDQFGAHEYFWIGFNDRREEGNWEWVSGEPVTYTNWWEGEPNNQSGEGKPEDAAIMNWGGSEQIDKEWISYYGDGWNDVAIDCYCRGIVENLRLADHPTLRNVNGYVSNTIDRTG